MAEIIFNKVPGMTEPVEQKMLYELSKVIKLKDNEIIYEFGPFLGRSTYYLAQGLSENTTKDNQHQIHTFDIFQCPTGTYFAPHVYKHIKAASVSDLLEEKNGILDFSKVFEHYLKDYISDGSVVPHKVTLNNSNPISNKKVALMHIDSPKRYLDFKNILFRFFPLLRRESLVIFQDFFFHWSGTLISAIQILVEMGVIKMLFTSASSLVVIILDKPDPIKIKELDRRMNEDYLPGIIDRAIKNTAKIKVDRRDFFEPRLSLAKIQLLIEGGEFEKASDTFNTMLKNNKFNSVLLYNFSNMLSQNFRQINHVSESKL